MGKTATAKAPLTTVLICITVLGLGITVVPLHAQTAADWRHVGNSLIDEALAGPASGPVERAWYSADGSQLRVLTASGRIYETSDFDSWHAIAGAAAGPPPEPLNRIVPVRLPEVGVQVRSRVQSPALLFAFGKFAYRSGDGGASWENLTAFRADSILGDNLRDVAISPTNPDDVVITSASGVFRSLDGGKSWSSLNQGLPNLPAQRLLSLPAGDRGVQLALADLRVVEWQPGDKQAWHPVSNSAVVDETRLRLALSLTRGDTVASVTVAGDFIYAGMADGVISVSSNRGVTWQNTSDTGGGAVTAFWVDPNDPRVALAAFGTRDTTSPRRPVHVMRTLNGGAFWDDLTANLPDFSTNGIAADRSSGAIYAATATGVFFTYAELSSLGTAQPWTQLTGLPQAIVRDVRLDAQGNQLWAAVEGFGVYSTLAPHRLRDPRVVSAADFIARAAAPGSLVSVIGANVQNARAGDLSVPVLAANDSESQIQIPFEARGTSISLAVDTGGARVALPPLALETASPAIFVDRDGSPMLLDADNGVMLDAMRPAHSNSHIQVLATGLGRVKPEWPTGLPAPLENPPQVSAAVHAYLDRSPVEVTRAVLAPGYVGFYLVEIEVPKIVNYGPAELYIEVDGQASNRVRVYIEP